MLPQSAGVSSSTGKMGNLVSFSTPMSDVSNFHKLSALDIDKQNVDFSTLDGKARSFIVRDGWPGLGPHPPVCMVLQVVLCVNVASK